MASIKKFFRKIFTGTAQEPGLDLRYEMAWQEYSTVRADFLIFLNVRKDPSPEMIGIAMDNMAKADPKQYKIELAKVQTSLSKVIDTVKEAQKVLDSTRETVNFIKELWNKNTVAKIDENASVLEQIETMISLEDRKQQFLDEGLRAVQTLEAGVLLEGAKLPAKALMTKMLMPLFVKEMKDTLARDSTRALMDRQETVKALNDTLAVQRKAIEDQLQKIQTQGSTTQPGSSSALGNL